VHLYEQLVGEQEVIRVRSQRELPAILDACRVEQLRELRLQLVVGTARIARGRLCCGRATVPPPGYGLFDAPPLLAPPPRDIVGVRTSYF
jgi:hypothetical protein